MTSEVPVDHTGASIARSTIICSAARASFAYHIHTGKFFTNTAHHDTYRAIDASQWDLAGKVVFITGASRGIGRAAAISFARAGASGIVIGARSTGALEEVEKATIDAAPQNAKGGGAGKALKVLSLSLDVTDEASVDAAAKVVRETFGRLDILINNAGYLETFREVAESNVEERWRTWEGAFAAPTRKRERREDYH